MGTRKATLTIGRTFAPALPEGVLMTDRRGTLVYVNPALEKGHSTFSGREKSFWNF
jgi:hypothetical protein